MTPCLSSTGIAEMYPLHTRTFFVFFPSFFLFFYKMKNYDIFHDGRFKFLFNRN